jgi:transposase
MQATSKPMRRGRRLTVERVGPALARLAEGAYAREAAEPAGVSIATVLNWMDWAWKHREDVDAFLRQNHPELNERQLTRLWQRIERRRNKRQRRADFSDWRSETG